MKSIFLLLPSLLLAQAPIVSGDAELRGEVLGKPLVLRTSTRMAGAIESFVWGGVEFIDRADHGRELQSAINANVDGVYHVECYNPTEAGSVFDGAGPTSTSVLRSLSTAGGVLRTETQMAFWLKPGGQSHGKPAQNTTALSNHSLRKEVKIGLSGLENVLDYKVIFQVPADLKHTYLQFEALTGYMPGAFSTELFFEPKDGSLAALPRKNGEVLRPVVLATADGAQAMGVYSPTRPAGFRSGVGYGRFQFEPEKVVKWNCVFRLKEPAGAKAGDYPFQLYVVFGSREDCRRALVALHERFPAQ